MTEHIAKLRVVGAHKCGVFFPACLSVEKHYRNAFVVGLADYIVETGGRVWRHDEQVYLFVDEMVDLLYLLFVAVVGRCYFEQYACVGILTEAQLVVLLKAPGVFGALRYSDAIFLRLFAARKACGGYYCQQDKKGVEMFHCTLLLYTRVW